MCECAQAVQQCKLAASGSSAQQLLRSFRALLRRPGLSMPGEEAVSLRARMGARAALMLHADAQALVHRFCVSGAGICDSLLQLHEQAQARCLSSQRLHDRSPCLTSDPCFIPAHARTPPHGRRVGCVKHLQ